MRVTERGMKTVATIVAIVALAFIEYHALKLDVDGAILSLVVAAISGLGGYQLGQVLKYRKK